MARMMGKPILEYFVNRKRCRMSGSLSSLITTTQLWREGIEVNHHSPCTLTSIGFSDVILRINDMLSTWTVLVEYVAYFTRSTKFWDPFSQPN